MNPNVALFFFLIAGFLFFRYIRANKSILTLILNFIFLGLAIYEIRKNIVAVFFIGGVTILEIYIARLKEKMNPSILKLQRGYKPMETILHYVFFGVIVFVLYVLIGLSR